MRYWYTAALISLCLFAPIGGATAQQTTEPLEGEVELESDDGVLEFDPASPLIPARELELPLAPYTLGAGDRIFMSLFGIDDYSKEYRVLADGTLNLPLIGPVAVQGLSLDAASVEIERLYRSYIRRPAVTLDLVQPRPIQVAIAGEVDRPGSYNIPVVQRNNQADEEQKITITQIIQTAGGITQSADIRRIQVYRPSPTGQGQAQLFEADLWQLLQAGDLSQDIALRDGDSVLVPEAIALSGEEVTELAAANFSPDTINVYVVGEVANPGAVDVRPNTPMNQALLAAGGFDLIRAARGSVRLVRLNPNGTVTERQVAVDFAADVNEETNPALRPNDTIIVGRSGLTSVTDTLEQIFNPLNGIFNFIRVLDGD